MEGDSGAGTRATAAAANWDLGMQWAPATSAYPHHFLPPPPPAGGASSLQRQQELTSLELGKRPCFLAARGGQVARVDGTGGGGRGSTEGKRKEKAAAATPSVPRCQVQGCHMVLAGAKEYHRRHKVCEAHSKATRVVVHGAEQRFCQQCSRFHAMSEFDETKRSCRRRLAGHNERRRKSNASDAMARGSAHAHAHGVVSMVHGFAPYGALATSPAGALSLLSSPRASPWLISTTPGDVFSARSSSAALDELIAENRAALLACHFFPDRSGAARPAAAAADMMPGGWHQQVHLVVGSGNHGGAAPPAAGHVTLDLMQTPATAGGPFRPMAPGRPAEDGDAGRSSGVWTPLQGAHVV
uniref:Uncharacterized protein n=1 Tax=Avena sativa TaxID=4498 RepID=A0ACD5UDD2_AVESA